MRKRFGVLMLMLWGAVLAASNVARAEHFRLAMPSEDDDYIIGLFSLALEAADGDHSFEVVRRVMLVQNRALRALADDRARYDVHYSGYDPDREKEFAMVPFPITRGMLGHRLLAVTAGNQNILAGVKSVEDLKAFRLGSGSDWPDTKILESAGLNVVKGSDANLWPMLARHRFDAFPRGINEIMAEIEGDRTQTYGANMAIEKNVILVYRFDHFFYLSQKNRVKAYILEQGLKNAFESGALDAYLQKAGRFQAVFAEMKQNPRRIIRLKNPLWDQSPRQIPDKYWREY